MQTIGAKVQIGDGHKLTLQLPESVSEGEYEVVLVLNNLAESRDKTSEQNEVEQVKDSITLRWQKWFDEVNKLPLKENPKEEDFQQYLVEKYRKQGLDL